MKKIFLYATVVFCTFSCAKENTTNGVDPIIFNGFSFVEENGNVVSEDPTDWLTNDKWNSSELGLFGLTTAPTYCTNTLAAPIIAYPIPCNGKFFFQNGISSSSRMELRIVDKNYKKLYSNDSIYNNTYAFDITGKVKFDTVRIYYRIIEKTCELHGHGDVYVK